MAKTRTYLDSGVLIAAAIGNPEISERALHIIEDVSRQLVTSDFVRLEVLPKPVHFQRLAEVRFYQAFFEAEEVDRVALGPEVVHQEQALAEELGLSALDALHLASASAGAADEFWKTEKPTKPMFRCHRFAVNSLFSI